jgi:Na+/H+ antiporter NhaD/arsenite permease-like protein
MYPLPQLGADHHFWSFLSYCAGTGGSMLIIGSAAGVVAMGIAKINFFWYLKKITPLAILGYCAGAAAYLLLPLN